jgi:hypothetical protein
MKRKIITTVAAIICCLNLSAQDSLKIMFLHPEPIVIVGKEFRKGDYFPVSNADNLTDRQVIRVFDAVSGKTRTFSKALMEKSGSKSIGAYLTNSKRLSTRNPFNRTFGLFERLALNGSLPIDSARYYYVRYEFRGETINKRLPADSTNIIIIDRSIFTIDGKPQKPFDAKLKLFYRDDNTKKNLLLSDKLALNMTQTDACREFISAYIHSGLDRESICELIVEYLDISCPDIEFLESDIELFVNGLMK